MPGKVVREQSLNTAEEMKALLPPGCMQGTTIIVELVEQGCRSDVAAASFEPQTLYEKPAFNNGFSIPSVFALTVGSSIRYPTSTRFAAVIVYCNPRSCCHR